MRLSVVAATRGAGPRLLEQAVVPGHRVTARPILGLRRCERYGALFGAHEAVWLWWDEDDPEDDDDPEDGNDPDDSRWRPEVGA